MTQREYLVNLGLAKPGRGRFSAEAKLALEQARKNGQTFDDDNKAPVAVPRKVNLNKELVVKVVGGKSNTSATSEVKLDLGQVRLWAADNGYTVAARGRVPEAVTDAYRADCKASGKAPAETKSREVPIEAERRWPEGTKFTATVTMDGKGNPLSKPIKVSVNERTACKCGVSLPWCSCLSRPYALVYSTAGITYEHIDVIR